MNFDDGTDGAYIGGFYGSSGVIFSNAYWFPNLSRNTGQPFDGASPGAFCFDRYAPDSNNGFPQIVYPSDPIIVLFTAPVTNVTVIALDVGDAGAEMDAYDSVVGGNLVATNQVLAEALVLAVFLPLPIVHQRLVELRFISQQQTVPMVLFLTPSLVHRVRFSRL